MDHSLQALLDHQGKEERDDAPPTLDPEPPEVALEVDLVPEEDGGDGDLPMASDVDLSAPTGKEEKAVQVCQPGLAFGHCS